MFLRIGHKVTTPLFMVGGVLFIFLSFSDERVFNESKILKALVIGLLLATVYSMVFYENASVRIYVDGQKEILDEMD